MSERPRILDYAPPWGKSLRTAWWFALAGFVLLLVVVIVVGLII